MSYPTVPGHKARDTSARSAQQITAKAPSLREACLHAIAQASEGLTADEVAECLRKSVLSIRPRITELDAMGLIEATQIKRPNVSGRQAIVWRIKARQVRLF